MHGWRPWVLVGLGGAVGSVARVLLSEAWGTEAGVLAVNLVGAFLLGVADAVWRGRRPLTLAFWGTGVLGGFTTFSAFSLDTMLLVERGRAGLADRNGVKEQP
mgnify:CR=1 FL=1